MKKAVVFGIGKRWERFKNVIHSEYNVVAFADNDTNKQGLIIDNCPVYKPCVLCKVEYDYILITVGGQMAKDIVAQLIELGIEQNKIIIYDKQIAPFVIDSLFFYKELTDEQKKTLFKNNVELVYLELNSQCNRKCWMCTNSVVDRHSTNIKLPKATLISVLEQLRDIEYDCDISLSTFNEPMIDSDLDSNIRLIKQYLPNAPLHFNTNGDFLTKQRLMELETLGLDFLPVSLYIDTPEKPWNYSDSVRITKNFIEKLGLTIDAISDENDTNTTCVCWYKSLPVVFRCANHRLVAGDRCGSIPESAPVKRFESAMRTCDRPFTLFTVNYNGYVTMCSNFHPDFEGHEQYIAGNVNGASIFDIYSSIEWQYFRKMHIGNTESTPCNTCGIISDIWGDVSISVMDFQPFRDRPRYR